MQEKMKKLGRVTAFFVKLAAAYICAFFLKLFCPDRRNIWLVAERGDDARDNGYFFYQYLRKEHPEINVWYVIKRSSADFPKIQQLGNWVEPNTFKHFVIYALCKVRIGAARWGSDLPYSSYFQKSPRWLLGKKEIVFLQHGITKDWAPDLLAENCPLDMFVCGAKPEWEYISKNYGHPEGVVQYTGLARFDNLHDIKTKNQVLFMPTFRMWLQGKPMEEVRNSQFVHAWHQVLKDPRLGQMLDAKDMEAVFYPHYVLQPYVELFHSENPRIKIAKFADYDVQQLLIESKLLVTDFSSVFFDFGYMEKPVIYYQFDTEQYIHEHYDFTKGYFDYKEMGFGPVAEDAEMLFAQIAAVIEKDFCLREPYAQRVETFFPLRDNRNCDRIFERIKAILGEQ